ncbi:hypothetical protein BDR26DRAFT_914107 [Obelidium mucronatum]|nr:hypothetical protein BDR26DRAFT_914107 [Obelidium mucronatum]
MNSNTLFVLLATVAMSCVEVSSQTTTTSASKPAHSPHLSRFGGPVIQNVEVNPIFYGDISNSVQAGIFRYYGAVVDSPWWNVLGQYGIQSGSIGRMFTVPASINKTLDDVKDIKPLLYKLAKQGSITPDPKGNSVYTLHIAENVTVTYVNAFNNLKSCKNLAGFHSAVNITDLNLGVPFLVYTVIPNNDCFSPSPAENINTMRLAAAHELSEAVTNPLFDVAMNFFATQGPKGLNQAAQYASLVDFNTTTLKYEGEIADFCESFAAPQPTTIGSDSKVYAVAKLWSNKDNACVSI